MKPEFLKAVQLRAARLAATASSTRGQGEGVVESARGFLGSLRLGDFGTPDERVFVKRLELATSGLREVLPKAARNWGLARKLLNIFLRDGLYTVYLTTEHGLNVAEPFFEIPLDSITAKRIRGKVPTVPRWLGVKHLDPGMSAVYQEAAFGLARQYGVARVHLDTYWWGARE